MSSAARVPHQLFVCVCGIAFACLPECAATECVCARGVCAPKEHTHEAHRRTHARPHARPHSRRNALPRVRCACARVGVNFRGSPRTSKRTKVNSTFFERFGVVHARMCVFLTQLDPGATSHTFLGGRFDRPENHALAPEARSSEREPPREADGGDACYVRFMPRFRSALGQL